LCFRGLVLDAPPLSPSFGDRVGATTAEFWKLEPHIRAIRVNPWLFFAFQSSKPGLVARGHCRLDVFHIHQSRRILAGVTGGAVLDLFAFARGLAQTFQRKVG